LAYSIIVNHLANTKYRTPQRCPILNSFKNQNVQQYVIEDNTDKQVFGLFIQSRHK